MRRFFACLAALIAAAACGCSETAQTVADDLDPKYREVSELPVGLKVTHSPSEVKAPRPGRDGRKHTWLFETAVEAVGEPVTITEFGAFDWFEGRWTFANFTGKPFTAEDFADWYSCPGAKLEPGRTFVDPSNWGPSDELRPGKTLWYFLGTTAAGKKVKGEAVVEKLAAIEE